MKSWNCVRLTFRLRFNRFELFVRRYKIRLLYLRSIHSWCIVWIKVPTRSLWDYDTYTNWLDFCWKIEIIQTISVSSFDLVTVSRLTFIYILYMNIKNLLLTFAFPSKAILLSLKSSFRLILSMSVSLEISKCFLFANCFSPPDHFLCFWGYFCIWIVVVISWGGHSSWVESITVTGNRPVETIPWTSHMVRTVYVWFVHHSFWIVTPIHIYIDF